MNQPSPEAFQNRLLKNLKHLRKWQKRTGHSCYRVYDADLPDYAFAIDLYADWAHIQEYAPPKTIDPELAKLRRQQVQALVPELLGIPSEHVVLKTRQRQKGQQQYETLGKRREVIIVEEGSARFLVNLFDYLDTGLFLDHRPLRLSFANHLENKRFLNCFCYTATASVHAALGGALTTNVDLSNTYLHWGQANFEINGLAKAGHEFIQADCMNWLADCKSKYDVIFLDPPSFSNSKRMQDILDIQRDHAKLIGHCMRCLTPDGVLYFSTNLQTFRLDETIAEQYQVKDITRQTIDEDFRHSPKIHQCYRLTSK